MSMVTLGSPIERSLRVNEGVEVDSSDKVCGCQEKTGWGFRSGPTGVRFRIRGLVFGRGDTIVEGLVGVKD